MFFENGASCICESINLAQLAQSVQADLSRNLSLLASFPFDKELDYLRIKLVVKKEISSVMDLYVYYGLHGSHKCINPLLHRYSF